MKRTLLFFLSFLLSTFAYNQSLSPEVTATAGDHFTGANAQLSWTIGEVMVETYENGTNQLTQGFHQTNLIVTTVEDPAQNLQLTIFPNPTTDILYVDLSAISESLSFGLYDVDGKQLLVAQTENGIVEKTIDLSSFASGTYFLKITNKSFITNKTFKIIKLK